PDLAPHAHRTEPEDRPDQPGLSHADQYVGRLGSISWIQARIPPLRFLSREKPAAWRRVIALALRTPLLQCTTMRVPASNSPSRAGNSGKGMTVEPAIRQMAISSGLRTSRIIGRSSRSISRWR